MSGCRTSPRPLWTVAQVVYCTSALSELRLRSSHVHPTEPGTCYGPDCPHGVPFLLPSLSGVASPGLGMWGLIDRCLILSSHPSDPWPPCLSQAWACPQQAQSGGVYLLMLNGCLYQEPSSLVVRDTQEMERLPREAPAMLLSGSRGHQPWGAIREPAVCCGTAWVGVLPLPPGGRQG